VWVTILTGATFAGAITSLPTSHGSVAFPTAAPAGADWTAEGAPIPPVTLNDSALISTPRKLAALLALSNESLADAVIPIGALTGQAIRDAMSSQMDDGLLHGDGVTPHPDGILGHATAAAGGPNFRTAVITAWGEVVDAGAPAESVVAFARPSVLATEWARVATTGEPVHDDSDTPGSLILGPGIRCVAVPSLAATEILVADVSSTFLVLREQLVVEMNDAAYFNSDSMALRVKARVACACPTPNKSLRTATITAGP
jgi:HK97 family phage major capsid protein